VNLLAVGLAIPSCKDAARHPNGSPARDRRIARAVLFCGAPLTIIESVEYTALHAAIDTTFHAAIHFALNLCKWAGRQSHDCGSEDPFAQDKSSLSVCPKSS
jgi:hypothetical protein